jgi:hypothetical protein
MEAVEKNKKRTTWWRLERISEKSSEREKWRRGGEESI